MHKKEWRIIFFADFDPIASISKEFKKYNISIKLMLVYKLSLYFQSNYRTIIFYVFHNNFYIDAK